MYGGLLPEFFVLTPSRPRQQPSAPPWFIQSARRHADKAPVKNASSSCTKPSKPRHRAGASPSPLIRPFPPTFGPPIYETVMPMMIVARPEIVAVSSDLAIDETTLVRGTIYRCGRTPRHPWQSVYPKTAAAAVSSDLAIEETTFVGGTTCHHRRFFHVLDNVSIRATLLAGEGPFLNSITFRVE
ncbi:uncharacterized protein ARMOST_02538 [Armillaria ostoyae]|uniref:Uncharacterized protein n=1 Tax=Armillaria ostoyae TaxID=47428 RepID=A0A284QS21_ARMOS|nr:uncharacterized protein ARMOST_02538 [Armillaria ostoyae]